MIQEGDAAPEFTLPAAGPEATEASLTLSALRPRRVVLYFYPRDATPGCTTEAQDFTGLAVRFAERGAVVVGVSKDTLKKHESFRTKSELTVTLVSDADSDLCERYGVWQEKLFMGRRSMGIVRSTFLIDGEGKVERVWSPVKVAGHAEEVLAALEG